MFGYLPKVKVVLSSITDSLFHFVHQYFMVSAMKNYDICNQGKGEGDI